MSLFSAIQKGANALQVAELGLQVVGNNIANAGTPGYIRQELSIGAGPSVQVGRLLLGQGVRADGIVQKLDLFVVDRMRQVRSEIESSDQINQLYTAVEEMMGVMTENGLGAKMNDFSSSIQEVLNQPGNEAHRRLVIERGHSLTGELRQISQQLDSFTEGLNAETRNMVHEINRLTGRVAVLNQRIVEQEGSRDTKLSDAVGLRDERIRVLDELSKYVSFRAVEQISGSVNVFVGGEYLVTESVQRPVKVVMNSGETPPAPEIAIADTNFPIEPTAGKLHGIYTARSGVIKDLRGTLDNFARDVIEQINRIHTQGQGSVGFRDLVSSNANDDPLGPLDLAGYSSSIQNGQFQVQVRDLETGSTSTHLIRVKLTGAADDTSLEDIRAQLDAISGLSASIAVDGRLRISTASDRLSFSFQEDSSYFLAAAGLNTFFSGNSASNIRVNPVIANDHRLFAASLSGVGLSTQNALKMTQVFDNPVSSLGDRSLKESFEDRLIQILQEVTLQRGTADGLRNFYRTLEARHLAQSGVNLDEEAVKMIFYQRMFQANSKLIKASSDMLEVLINL
jgi:flagellar hook-associated protein 1 FlgK